MSDEPDAYQSYLLRLWRAPCQGRWQWRASLESRRTGERHAFASLEQLFTFVSERCDSRTPCEADECPEGQWLSGRGVPVKRKEGA